MFVFTILFTIFIGFWILLTIAYIRDVYCAKSSYAAAKSIPGNRLYPILGNAPAIMRLDREGTFRVLREAAIKYKASWRYWMFGVLAYQCIKADEVELLIASSKHSSKSFIYNFLHPFIGTGLLCSGGAKWAQRRRILTPAFHFNILQNFFKTFKKETEMLVEQLSAEVDQEEAKNIQTITSRFALNVIVETAMGVELNAQAESDSYRLNIREIGEHLVHRLMRPWLYFEWFCELFGYNTRLNKPLKPTHDFIDRIIKQRRTVFKGSGFHQAIDSENIYLSKKQHYAMLDTLLSAEANNQIDESGIREEVNTFTFEGFDTSSTGMTFILLLVATHPDAQQRVYEEIQQFLRSKEIEVGDIEMQDYSNLDYMNRVIKECLRLYPPVSFISRSLSEDLVVNNVTIPKERSMAHVHIYDLHRDPEQFPDPERFDPDRFLPENTEKRHPFAYIPFSAGPRNCIGQKFALLEIQTMLVGILNKYRLEAVTKREDIVFVADLILRPRDPILIKFFRR